MNRIGWGLLVLLFMAPLKLWGSACETEPAEWSQEMRVPSAEEKSAIEKMHFSRAVTASSPRGQIHLGGSPRDLESLYEIRKEVNQGFWTLVFEKDGKIAGTLHLDIPQSWEFYHSNLNPAAVARTVTHEIRLEGHLSGDGIFSEDLKEDSVYRLILQGEGTRCFEASQLQRWILQVEGSDPEYLSERAVYYWFYGTTTAGS